MNNLRKNKEESARKQSGSVRRILGVVCLVAGNIGLACAFIILYEKLQLLANPGYKPPCSLNPVISCGSVMESSQSHLFGFPNPIIGLAAFPVVITSGILLLTRVQLPKWYLRGLLAGSFLGLIFVHWLFFESVYRIQALCPFCMVVWVCTITIFWYSLLYNLEISNVTGMWQRTAAFMRRHHVDILVVWLLGITGLILNHFWYYFGPK